MTDGNRVKLGTIELAWDPEVRLAVLRFERETRATGRDGVALVAAMDRWVGTGKPFGLLGDGGRLSGVDAEYRSVWGRFLRQHRDCCYLAFFNMGTVIRVAAEMFRVGTGLQVKAFADEGEARSWLRKMGIDA